MPVQIGDEVGFGRGTSIYTHGVYQSILNGFPVKFAPVTIGDNVWLPGAIVNPGVTIGDNVIVGVGSLVRKNLPSGCFAAGFPAKILRENCYPKKLSEDKQQQIINNINVRWNLGLQHRWKLTYSVDGAIIELEKMQFSGLASEKSERARNILRRHGIRFKVDVVNGQYVEWK